MTDRDIIAALLECQPLSEWEEEAFQAMRDWLDGGEERSLSERQREVATKAAHDKGVWSEPAANLWSSGKVPRGILMPKTDGEKRAAAVLGNRPTRPPGRSA
jgi:hypothetical protein